MGDVLVDAVPHRSCGEQLSGGGRCPPLFMRDDQIFQPADELKTDLRALDQFYSTLPAETMKDGLFKAAPRVT